MKNKLWKLAQMLIQFKKYVTDNGVLVIDGDLAEGVEVSVENENGDLEPAADGEYELGDNLKISVADGKVTQIVEEKEEEPIEEPTEEPEPMAEEPTEEPTEEPNNEPDEKDLRIEELEGLLKDRDAIIEELTAKIKELEEEIAKPVEEPVKMAATVQEKNTPQSGALKYFQK
jgi:hypothetical protein